MALTVEDGTGIEGANSYVEIADLRTYAQQRGIALPAADGEVEVLLTKAMDYLAQYDDRFLGAKADQTQPLAWPRVTVPQQTPPLWWESAVPDQVKRAQMVLAIAAQSGPLYVTERPGVDRGAVKAVTVGPIKTEYATKDSVGSVSANQPKFPEVDILLSSWLQRRSLGATVTANRG